MGRFSLDAPWIRRIFPPSVVPATAQPFAVSDDIQLTQDFLAKGQVQRAHNWINQFDFGNPGADNTLVIIDPTNDTTMPPAAVLPEVWRVFFVSLETGGTTGDFIFNLNIGQSNPSVARTVQISDNITIAAAELEKVSIFPVISTERIGVVGLAAPAGFGYAGPLLLPVDPSAGTGPFLALKQISAQASSTETLRVSTYIMRNLQGVAHAL